jgi:TRAP-type C4-dicarboxylate transport system substrate-binding protein
MRGVLSVVIAALAAGAHAATAAEPMAIKFAYPASGSTKLFLDGVQPWVEQVNAQSNGTVEVKVFLGPALGTFNNIYDRTLNGVTEISFGIFGALGGQFPKTNVSSLPFEGENCTETSVAMWRLLAKGVTADEYDQVRPLGLFTFPPSGYHAKKPIREADDLKGLKIAVFARTNAQQVELLGGTPITMQPTESYQSVQRGLVAAVGTGWVATSGFKLYEVTNFHLDAALGQGTAFVFMNKEAYAKLPVDGKQAVDKLSYEAFSRDLGKANDAMEDEGRTHARAMAGQTVERIEPKVAAIWKQRLAPLTEEWVKSTPDGAAVLAAYRAEIQKIRSGK